MCRPCSLSPAASVAPASALVAALPLAPVPGLWPAFVLLSLSPHRNKTNKKEGESRAAGERAGGADGRLLVSFSTRPDEQRARLSCRSHLPWVAGYFGFKEGQPHYPIGQPALATRCEGCTSFTTSESRPTGAA